jgi:hypothetical protein
MTDKGEKNFPQLVADLNKGPKKESEMPPLHPRPDELVDISKEETEERITNQLLKAKKFGSNYRVFDISNEDQRTQLEEIMDHILQDGWLLGYEEKQILQNGRVIVFVKYLIPSEPVTRQVAPEDVVDTRAKQG